MNGKSNFIKNLGNYGVSEEDAKRVFLKSDEMNRKYKLGKMTDEEYWSWALKQWNLDMTVQDVIDLLISGYEVNGSAVEYVKKVRNAGYKTLICSNNFPARINGLQNRFGFLDDFDVHVFSYDVGFDKPSKEIFQILIERAEVFPEEVFYSDDDETKMDGAKELGITTFLYTDFDAFVDYLESLSVKV